MPSRVNALQWPAFHKSSAVTVLSGHPKEPKLYYFLDKRFNVFPETGILCQHCPPVLNKRSSAFELWSGIDQGMYPTFKNINRLCDLIDEGDPSNKKNASAALDAIFPDGHREVRKYLRDTNKYILDTYSLNNNDLNAWMTALGTTSRIRKSHCPILSGNLCNGCSLTSST